MQALLSKLPAFALPFVTRSLRGGRGRRYLIFSLFLTAMTGVIGLWLALGSGSFEQELRIELGFEQHEFERERETFTVIVHDSLELREVERELARMNVSPHPLAVNLDYSEASGLVDWSRQHVELAATAPTHGREQNQLKSEALALVGPYRAETFDVDPDWYAPFPWHDAHQVEQLRTILAHRGVPAVEVYTSPLGLSDAVRITGFLAGLLLAGLATVFAPLLVAVQQAQERHENTLMPLTGTSLSPRQLALGLASGPTAVIGIFAIPQLAVFLLCATVAGQPLVALGLLAALAATGALFILGGQLLGQLLGHRRTPGIIGIALMGLAGVAWLTGGSLAASADYEVIGFAAVLPHIGLSALLAEVFVEVPFFSHLCQSTFVWTGGALMLSWLTLTALAHKIEGREGPLLTRMQAGLGALTSIVLVNVAIPDTGYNAEALRQFVGLAMLALPLAMLLMARVPAGDGAPRMRRVPIAPLLGEFGVWAAVHVVLAGVVFGFDCDALHPVALIWMGWCVATLGLIAIRVVAVPATIATNVWTAFCALSLTVGFGQSVFWGMEHYHDAADLFVMFELSPVLGLLQVGLTVWIPLSILRHLRKHLGSIR